MGAKSAAFFAKVASPVSILGIFISIPLFLKFANAEGIIPAPEATHAVKGAIDAAIECKKNGKSKTILFNLCGHGHFDMKAYGDYFSNNLAEDNYNENEVNKALEKLPKIT